MSFCQPFPQAWNCGVRGSPLAPPQGRAHPLYNYMSFIRQFLE